MLSLLKSIFIYMHIFCLKMTQKANFSPTLVLLNRTTDNMKTCSAGFLMTHSFRMSSSVNGTSSIRTADLALKKIPNIAWKTIAERLNMRTQRRRSQRTNYRSTQKYSHPSLFHSNQDLLCFSIADDRSGA
ncbi:hypothetical protein CHARACLAT_028968 [Characodon lateralis]|uniref:Uncharacterized protein n=1 Tax=Characodon lateralis TaxID=208331 RepID=A0ABU7E4Q7_9TELE|nr:hypothetical protein [Characodon lateralis]